MATSPGPLHRLEFALRTASGFLAPVTSAAPFRLRVFEALLPAVLGPLVLDDGERVYPERGLAVRANPANGVLLELIGFAPTTAEDYRTRLRPALPVETPLPERQGGAA